MTEHPLVAELQKLKESSKEAIADSQKSIDDELKQYLHIERPVDTALKGIITQAQKQAGAVLILVCGNVGDGKSHTLSNLRKDPNISPLLKDFQVHNDATESFSPDESCIDTLNHILDPFADHNLETASAKWILAINLGTLSNFLEIHGEKYSRLLTYIQSNSILEEGKAHPHEYHPNSPFQFVNFTDYHLYSLTRNGVQSKIIEGLLDRITAKNDGNPIHKARKALQRYEWELLCPVARNFDFLSNDSNRKTVSYLLLQAIIKNKTIISFRHLLNFIHDALVPFGYSYNDLKKYEKELKATNRSNSRRKSLIFEDFLPYYIFEHASISRVFASLRKIDPCNQRVEQLDDELLQLHANTNPSTSFEGLLDNNSTSASLLTTAINNCNDTGKLSKLYIRLHYFHAKGEWSGDYFQDYTEALFAYNNQDRRLLRPIYQLVEKAIRKWNGNTNTSKAVLLNLASYQDKYRILKDVDIKAVYPSKPLEAQTDEIIQFLPQLILSFELPTAEKQIDVGIDYSLFVLLNRVTKGYRPNKIDQHDYISFVRFIDKLTLSNAAHATLLIDEINIGSPVDYQLQYDQEFNEFTFTRVNKN